MLMGSSSSGPIEPVLSITGDDRTPPSVVTITIAGELDIVTAPSLAGQLAAVIDRGHRQVSVDLRKLGFCDVAGLNLLVAADARLRALDGHLTMYGPSPAVQILLDVLGPDVGLELVPPPRG